MQHYQLFCIIIQKRLLKMRYIYLVFFLGTLLYSDAAYNRGETLFLSKACSSCHGASAEGSSTYPRLANKKKLYLLKKLHYYKIGKVSSVSQQMMAQFIQKLTEQNMQDLASFLSRYKKVEVEDVADDILGGFGS
jgi:cytochrome c553